MSFLSRVKLFEYKGTQLFLQERTHKLVEIRDAIEFEIVYKGHTVDIILVLLDHSTDIFIRLVYTILSVMDLPLEALPLNVNHEDGTARRLILKRLEVG